jgi:hypothetical protein
LIERFVRELRSAIDTYAHPYLDEPAFLDEAKLRGGQYWEPALAQAICQSLCMVVVYTPQYERPLHHCCQREYAAMEKLAEQRLAQIRSAVDNHSLIIPIILRGDIDNLPPKIKERQYIDFRPFTLASRNISKNSKLVRKVQEIVDTINRLLQAFESLPEAEEPWKDCAQFTIPEEGEVAPWRPPKIPPFPGRSERS